jgi:hypothetical protein
MPTDQAVGFGDEAVPLERGAGVLLVALDVKMAEQALVGGQDIIIELDGNELAGGIAGIVAADAREDRAERGGEMGEGDVLGVGQVVLIEGLGLDAAANDVRRRGTSDEVWGADAAVAEAGGDGYAQADGIAGVPLIEEGWGGDGAAIGDFDADGTAVADGGVPGAFAEVEGLVEGAVEVEEKVDAQATGSEHGEAFTTGAGGVVVDDELLDFGLEEGKVPAVGANAGEFFGVKQIVARAEGPCRGGGARRGVLSRGISTVAAGIGPEEDGGSDVKELATGNDLVAAALGWERGAGSEPYSVEADGQLRQHETDQGDCDDGDDDVTAEGSQETDLVHRRPIVVSFDWLGSVRTGGECWVCCRRLWKGMRRGGWFKVARARFGGVFKGGWVR